MADLTPNYKVPRTALTDPMALWPTTQRNLATYLDGLPWTSVGALAAGWSGVIRVARFGQVVTVHVDVTKASFSGSEIITATSGAGVFLPAGCIPTNHLTAYGIDTATGAARAFQVLNTGRVQAATSGTGGINGVITYIAPAP